MAKIIIYILLLILSIRTEADPVYNHPVRRIGSNRVEVSVSLPTVGLGAMTYKGLGGWSVAPVPWSLGIGGSVTWWATRCCGIRAGVDVDYMHQSNTVSELDYRIDGRVPLYDGQGSRDVRVSMDVNSPWVSDQQSSTMFHVPLELVFQIRQVSIAGGIDFVYPLSLSGAFEYGASTYNITRFDELMVSMENSPVFVGKADQRTANYSTASNPRPYFICAMVELGLFNIPVDRQSSITIGVLGRYAIDKYKLDNEDVSAIRLTNDILHGTMSSIPPSQTSLVSEIGYFQVALRLVFHWLGYRHTL